jgi:hypothetical protein
MTRFSFYREIHKAIRAMLLDAVTESGRLDWTDGTAAASFRRNLENVFVLLAAHAEHEEEFIAPLLEKSAISVAHLVARTHRHHDVALRHLLAQLEAIDSNAPDAEAKGHEFVVALSRFAGETLIHMAEEEEEAMPALWRVYTDGQLLDVGLRLIGSIAPDERAGWLPWQRASFNHKELVKLETIAAELAAPRY